MNRLRDLRAMAGISLAALAREAELSTKTITRIERGERVAATSQRKVVIAYNNLVGEDRRVTFTQMFPDA